MSARQYDVGLGMGLAKPAFEVVNEAGKVEYRLLTNLHRRTHVMRDSSQQEVAIVKPSYATLFSPTKIELVEQGLALFKKDGFWRSNYTITLPDSTSLAVFRRYRKLTFKLDGADVATAAKKLLAVRHVYRIEILNPSVTVPILVALCLLGTFSSSSSGE